MNGEKLTSIALAIISLAGIAVVINSANTANVLKTAGAVFIGSIKTAQGRA